MDNLDSSRFTLGIEAKILEVANATTGVNKQNLLYNEGYLVENRANGDIRISIRTEENPGKEEFKGDHPANIFLFHANTENVTESYLRISGTDAKMLERDVELSTRHEEILDTIIKIAQKKGKVISVQNEVGEIVYKLAA